MLLQNGNPFKVYFNVNLNASDRISHVSNIVQGRSQLDVFMNIRVKRMVKCSHESQLAGPPGPLCDSSFTAFN
ncbi:hypothetical protein J6590_072595 [Homalodisca vitripennis]|nr:hypothetical protein J6590_072595 [Homalodisca vitripennis]